jgi:asparagine synthase (glutamine-hydrolysing)
MQESIDKHIIADVEVGCFLSGGLDSSTLVHYMEQHPQGRLKTFTVGYDQPSYDERPYARAVTQRYNTEHIEMVCGEEDVIDFLEKLPLLGDSPIGDQAIVSTYLVSKLACKHVKVCLSGDGGDELFLGYPTYHANQIYPYCERLPDAVWRMLGLFLNTFPASDKKVSFDYKAKRFLEGVLMHDQYRAHAYWRVIFTQEERKRLFKADRYDGYSADRVYDCYYSLVSRKQDVQHALAQADFTAWLPNNNLLRTDIFSMSNSLEVRVPLLHLPLVTFIMSLPFQQRFKGSTKKYLLKRLMEPKLGKQIVHRKKEGWHMPLAPWLKSGLFDYCHDIFSSQHHLFDVWLNRDYCLQLLNDHKKGLANNTYKIWGVLTLLKQIKQK